MLFSALAARRGGVLTGARAGVPRSDAQLHRLDAGLTFEAYFTRSRFSLRHAGGRGLLCRPGTNAMAGRVIGLSATGDREADRAARRFLPTGRAPSVFNAPPLAALGAASHEEANETSRRVSGRGLSQQSFALLEKILQVAEIAAVDARVFEAHPEVSFAALAGEQALPSKKTWDGLMQRRALLSAAGLAIPDLVGEASRRAAADDIVDAVACAWTAARITPRGMLAA